MEEHQIIWLQGGPEDIPVTIWKTMMRGLYAVCIAGVIMKFICSSDYMEESNILQNK